MAREEALRNNSIAQAFTGRNRYINETGIPNNGTQSTIADEASAYLKEMFTPPANRPSDEIKLEYFTANGIPLNTVAAKIKLDEARSLIPVGITDLEIKRDIFARFALNEAQSVNRHAEGGTVYTASNYVSPGESTKQVVKLFQDVTKLHRTGRSVFELISHIKNKMADPTRPTDQEITYIRRQRKPL